MKKILMSVMVIAVTIGVVATGLSGAWFSDTESTAGNPGNPDSPGKNILTAGSIDLDPIMGTVTIEDMKPCEDHWGYIWLHNAGMNDGNAWLHFTNVIGVEHGIVDAEEDAYWERSGYAPDALRYDNDLERFMTVDLYVDLPEEDLITMERGPGKLVISKAWDWKLADIESQWIPLGELVVCDYVQVWLSFHIQDEAGNQYQTDKVRFDIEVMLLQKGADDPTPVVDLTAPKICDQRVLRLENKENFDKPAIAGGYIAPNLWKPLLGDGKYGILTFDCKKPTFDYTFEGYGLADGDYKLIYYADPWPGSGKTGVTGVLIGKGLASGGRLSLSDNLDLNTDIPNSDDANYPDGVGKIWLVLSSDYSEGTPGNQGSMIAWNPSGYLFEMRLINYNDTDAP